MSYKKSEGKNRQEIKWPTIIYALIFSIAGYLLVSGILIYGFDVQNNIIEKTKNYFPYPVANIGTDFVRFGSLDKRVASVKKFYESQNFDDLGLRVDFSTADGKKRLKIKEKEVISKMIEEAVIEKEAKSKGIIITAEMVDQEVSRKLQEYGSENYLKDNLAKLYGWNLEDFKENIVKPDLYKEKLEEKIRQEDPSFAKAKAKIGKASEELKKGKDFSEVVKSYSEGESVQNEGELGWFSADQMLSEISQIVFKLNKGQTSEIIESPIGYHIIRVEDKKTQNNVDMVRVSQIIVRTKTFGQWLGEAEENISINIWIKGLRWNKENSRAEFKDGELRDFENNLDKNSPNDISVMF